MSSPPAAPLLRLQGTSEPKQAALTLRMKAERLVAAIAARRRAAASSVDAKASPAVTGGDGVPNQGEPSDGGGMTPSEQVGGK